MKLQRFLGMCAAAFIAVAGLTACSDNNDNEQPVFIENASLQEEGQTLAPGNLVHLEGEGYQEGDDVMLNFYWPIDDPYFTEGSLIGYRAEVTERTATGITIRLPYRKPASRVEVQLLRSGEQMSIGTLHTESGLTPSDVRLYGIDSDANIIRCIYAENAADATARWTMGEHPDFHSALGCYNTYGLCGLAEYDGKTCPYFFDFCTGEWKQLSPYRTLALFATTGEVFALQMPEEGRYTLNSISTELDHSNYATASTRDYAPAPTFYTLPEGVTAAQFGDYPGAYSHEGMALFTANKGGGKWTPVLFSFRSSQSIALDEVEAEALIPFSFLTKQGEQTAWKIGYAAAGTDDTTRFYLLDEDKPGAQAEPFATHEGTARSITTNYNHVGTLTVHFGNSVEEYAWDNGTWTKLSTADGASFDEMVWTN